MEMKGVKKVHGGAPDRGSGRGCLAEGCGHRQHEPAEQPRTKAKHRVCLIGEPGPPLIGWVLRPKGDTGPTGSALDCFGGRS